MGYGLMLLRCTPMLLSAASVNYDYNEWLFYHPFINLAKRQNKEPNSLGDDRRPLANRFLQHYIHEVFQPGFAAILVLYPLSWATTAAILTLAAARTAPSCRAWPLLWRLLCRACPGIST